MAKTKAVTAAQIEALLPFVRTFEVMGFQCGECPQSELDSPHGSIIPGFGANDPVASFVEALHDHGWIEPFDWNAWQDQAARYVASPALVAGADAETIRKLLTSHVRKDRERHGHLAAQFESGHVLELLRRLRAIATERA
jgi:hypothetical protein